MSFTIVENLAELRLLQPAWDALRRSPFSNVCSLRGFATSCFQAWRRDPEFPSA